MHSLDINVSVFLSSDPHDVQYLGQIQVNDAVELLVGMSMSMLASFFSDYVASTGIYDSGIDWGIWRCNVLSCMLNLAVYAYGTSRNNHRTVNLVHNIIAAKFVSSFCGSLSCFSSAVATSMVHTILHVRVSAHI
jgi:hypothetical protein